MPAKASTRRRRVRSEVTISDRPWIVREEPVGFGQPRQPSKPVVLVLEEQNGSTYALAGSIKAGGYNVQTIFEEAQAVAKIMSAMHRHVLLLIAHGSHRPLRTVLAVQELRHRGYEWPIVYCVKGKVSPEMQSSYEQLSVDKVLSVPAKFCSPVLATLEWLGGCVDLSRSGMTILEF